MNFPILNTKVNSHWQEYRDAIKVCDMNTVYLCHEQIWHLEGYTKLRHQLITRRRQED